jgi:hypothetical protein
LIVGVDLLIDVDVDFTAFSLCLYTIFGLCANGKSMVALRHGSCSSPTISKASNVHVSFLFATLEIATRARQRSKDWKRTSKARERGDVNIFPLEDIKKIKKAVIHFVAFHGKNLFAMHGKRFASHSKATNVHVSFLFATLEIATRARQRSKDWKRTSKVLERGYVNIFPLQDIKKIKKAVIHFVAFSAFGDGSLCSAFGDGSLCSTFGDGSLCSTFGELEMLGSRTSGSTNSIESKRCSRVQSDERYSPVKESIIY